MSQRHYYRDVSGVLHEQSDFVPQQGWSVQFNAEEGTVGSARITVDDPDMDKDFTGHRMWAIFEDESESDDDRLYVGYVGAQDVSRGFDADSNLPLGRVWTLELFDLNTVLSRRIIRSGKRPAETDVERVQWLLGTTELGYWISDITTYVSTASPVAMDKNDYTGQTTNAIWDDCAQQSGKNWFVMNVEDVACAFYGDYTYDSPLALSNDRADFDLPAIVDGTATTWPIGKRTNLRRDPSRVFSGGYGEYEKGRIYRHRASTETEFALGDRDMTVPMVNVKTKAKAIARIEKALDLASTQDERVTTEVVLPNAKATMLKPGMRVRFKATHEPGYDEFVWMRILNAIPTPIAGGNRYRIGLELQGPGEAAPAPLFCSLAMSNSTGTTLDTPEPAASGSMSLGVSPTYAGPTILIPVFSVTAGNPSNSIGAFSGGFSTLQYDNTTQVGVALRIGFQQGTAPATFTAGATWDTFGPGDGGLLAVHAAIPSSATTTVQANYQTGAGGTGLISPPTPGNIVVMVCHAWGNNVITGPNVPGPTTGWTTLGFVSNTATLPVPPYNGINRASLAVYARCVEPGEGTDYDFAITGGNASAKSTYLAEFTV